MQAAISATNLEIGYKSGNLETKVSQISSFELRKGKLTCLLGANGIGKSTLLRTITGNLQPLNGEVLIDGQPINELSVNEKARKLAVLLTDKAHLGFTTVREMITLGRSPYTNWMNTLRNDDSQAIEQALEAIGMTEFANKPLAELSDGNLQKVVIGRAIAQETDIIVLDEPTIHLDIKNKTIIVELLKKLCQEYGKSILISTHDLELAKQYADQFWLMEKNNLVQGLPEDLILSGEIDRILGSVHSKTAAPQSKLKIRLIGNGQKMQLLESALERMGYEVDNIADLSISSVDDGFHISGHEISSTMKKIESVLEELSNYDKE